MILRLDNTHRNCIYRSCIEPLGPLRVSDPPTSYHNQEGVIPFQETRAGRHAEEVP